MVRAGRFGPGEEIDIDAADPFAAELDVARARAAVEMTFALAGECGAMSDEATACAAASAKTPAFGVPVLAMSPIA